MPAARQDSLLSHHFDASASGSAETRKAFFQSIRDGKTAEVEQTLHTYPQAAQWREPFGDRDNPFAKDCTPLMIAAEYNRPAIARALLNHGATAEIDQRNSRGWTALMYAGWHGRTEIAEMLIWHAADTWPKLEDNHDALTMARVRGHDDIGGMIEAHRNRVDGPAACTNGLKKPTCVMKPLRLRVKP